MTLLPGPGERTLGPQPQSPGTLVCLCLCSFPSWRELSSGDTAASQGGGELGRRSAPATGNTQALGSNPRGPQDLVPPQGQHEGAGEKQREQRENRERRRQRQRRRRQNVTHPLLRGSQSRAPPRRRCPDEHEPGRPGFRSGHNRGQRPWMGRAGGHGGGRGGLSPRRP